VSEEEVREGIRITDRRKFDPVTGEARQPVGQAAPAATAEAPGAILEAEAEPVLLDSEAQGALAGALARAEEATADAKRIAAEYANYRKRVDRDRELQRELAVKAVFADLLPVLDSIELAREHGELTGGFKSVADALEAVTGKHGVTAIGAVGEPFDPMVHHGVLSEVSDEVDGPTVVRIFRNGYRLKDHVLRAAEVVVADQG
jgi:molecular chaperone GrpE